jgi:cation:H+ antiporter
MEIILLFSLLLASLFVLVKSAQLVEDAFIHIARRLKISEFFIGFVILAIITSLPEFSIAVISSSNIPELSVGNLLGATTILITLIIGASAIKYKNLKFKGKFSEKEIFIGIALLASMILVLLDRYISVIEGISLLVFYILYVIYINWKFNGRKHSVENISFNPQKIYERYSKAAIGMLLLIISSSLIVKSAESLASIIQISPSLIGLVLLALGTNIPELTILVTSKKTIDQKNLSLGNFFGSACVNPGILGLLAVLSGGVGITDFPSIVPVIVIMTLSLVLFSVFAWTGKTLTRNEGIILIGGYVSLIITEALIIATI